MAKNSPVKESLPYSISKNIESLGNRLSLARKRRGHTLTELASMSSISKDTLIRLERGASSVGLSKLLSVLSSLDFPFPPDGTSQSFPWPNEGNKREYIKYSLSRIGSAIRGYRKARKITAKNLAAAIYISPNTIYRIERGQDDPSLALTFMIFACLGQTEKLNGIAKFEEDRTGMILDRLKLNKIIRIRRKHHV